MNRITAGNESGGFGQPPLRILTCGSVDDGKSTLIGRLLFDSEAVPEDQLVALEKDSRRFGTTGNALDLALLLDGLEAERQQGITIDVAYRYFRTKSRTFILADTPGHEQYTRNMVTGASSSDAAILLVDARKGLLRQTFRHASICELMGVRHIIVAVNKMDLVGFSEEVFTQIATGYRDFQKHGAESEFRVIPVSALRGDNVVERSRNISWYDGPTVLEHLQQIEVAARPAVQPFRLPVQWVNRPNSEFRGFSGTVTSGRISAGDRLRITGSGHSAAVTKIATFDGDLTTARAGDAITVTLDRELDIARGDLLVREGEKMPHAVDQFAAMIVWMGEEPLIAGRGYLLRVGTMSVPATVTTVRYKLDVATREHNAARQLELNEIAHCHVSTSVPVAFDAYRDSRETGSFIFIDRGTGATVGAGMIEHPLSRAENVHKQWTAVTKENRVKLNGHKPVMLWFTGLSGSGKSTITNLVERSLYARGVHTYLLDGDNVRMGLNKDLGFTVPDRVENIRRVGEVGKLFLDAGLIVLCSFISPFEAERRMVRELMDDGEFLEIYVNASVETCIRRDPKGLYQKAMAGEINNFTGLSSPYEPPEHPDLILNTETSDAEHLAAEVTAWLTDNGYLKI